MKIFKIIFWMPIITIETLLFCYSLYEAGYTSEEAREIAENVANDIKINKVNFDVNIFNEIIKENMEKYL